MILDRKFLQLRIPVRFKQEKEDSRDLMHAPISKLQILTEVPAKLHEGNRYNHVPKSPLYFLNRSSLLLKG